MYHYFWLFRSMLNFRIDFNDIIVLIMTNKHSSLQDEEDSNLNSNSSLAQALQRLTNLHPELTSRPKLRSRVRPKRLKTSQDICDLVIGGDRTRDFSKLFRVRIPDSRDPIPVRVMTLAESSREHRGVPHSWLCNGKLLVLEDPTNPANISLFQVSRWMSLNVLA